MVARTIISVGTFIYSLSTKRYLFLLRNTNKFSGYWALPGGKLETNEFLLQSLTRELQEEINYDFSTAKVIPVDQFTSQNNSFVYHTFFIPVTKEFVPFLNQEHRGYCWVEIKDLPRPMHPGLWKTVSSTQIQEKLSTIINQLSVFNVTNSSV